LRAYNVYKAESFFVNEKLFAVKLPPFWPAGLLNVQMFLRSTKQKTPDFFYSYRQPMFDSWPQICQQFNCSLHSNWVNIGYARVGPVLTNFFIIILFYDIYIWPQVAIKI
jgi:hypothetical protein